MDLLPLRVQAQQKPLLIQRSPLKKRTAWWTRSLCASKRIRSWWLIVKERVFLLNSRSSLGLLWAMADRASCSRGCSARQEACLCVVWSQHGVLLYSLLFCSHLSPEMDLPLCEAINREHNQLIYQQ